MITMRNEEENVLVSVFITGTDSYPIRIPPILIIKMVISYILFNNRFET
jgi:hypothetical protein